MKFVNWDDRPAVLNSPTESAFARLEPFGPWVKVDFFDVASTAGLMTESRWRARFTTRFGELDPPNLDAKDGSDAAIAAE